MRFNPFSFLNESRDNPHARTLRTSFSEKLGDTFSVFCGEIYPRREEARMGLFDWATLGIPAFLARSEVYMSNSYNPWFLLLKFPVYGLNRMLDISRFLVSVIATFTAAPITFLAAGIVRLVDRIQCPNGLEEVGMVQGNVKSNWMSSSKPVNERVMSLEQLFRESRSGINNMYCTKITSDQIEMRISGRSFEGPSTYTFMCDRNNEHTNRFFRYNIGKINNTLEKSSPTPSVNP
ncbi:hypothetical protein [Legionella worsleiensis]|uniref:Transmembrane protein n=1 Tax=Legionella worsleiensis TaxID=45076 RepID=A0A0W1AIS9_9GAMM|nr:hypothetical protein [Legionella worsleiensis]KTD81193.1 hypothetical protein Lwor_0871 [Legionella worsleiensis]STY33169.1 Uncharacterised protein [Legionella worsleiensis]